MRLNRIKLLISLLMPTLLFAFDVGDKISYDFHKQAYFSGDEITTNESEYCLPVNINCTSDNLIYYELESKNIHIYGSDLTIEDVYEDHLYTKDNLLYSYSEFDDTYATGDGESSNNDSLKAKRPYISSVCKIRSYYNGVLYHNRPHNVTFDSTGFLVGESLVMTVCHGIYLDATSNFPAGSTGNYYLPTKIEVYGALDGYDNLETLENRGDYRYFSKVTELFLDGGYINSLSLNNDWCLLRIEKPLGKELSYRILSSETSNFNGLRISGYERDGYEYNEVSVDNGNYLSNNNLFRYDTSTMDGMSGAPIFKPNAGAFFKGSTPFLVARVAYGMHIAFNDARHLGIGLKFSDSLINLVDLLNSKYRPDEINIDFSCEHQYWLGTNFVIPYELWNEYTYDIHENSTRLSSDVAILNGTYDSHSFFSIRTNFPIRNIAYYLEADTYNINDGINITSNSAYNNTYHFINNASSGYYSLYFMEPAFEIKVELNDININVAISNLVIYPEWDYIPVSPYSPTYNSQGILLVEQENCLSYAVKNLLDENSPYLGRSIIIRDYVLQDRIHPGILIFSIASKLSDLGISIRKMGKYDVCENFGYRIAIFCDPFRTFHVLRQNDSGYFSHYLVYSGSDNRDSCSALIKDPESCRILNCNDALIYPEDGQRLYEGPFDLSIFVGYFEVFGGSN